MSVKWTIMDYNFTWKKTLPTLNIIMKEADDYDEGKKEVKEFSWMPAGCSPLADGEYGKKETY